MTCVEGLPIVSRKDAFVFATSALPELPARHHSHSLREHPEDKGFRVIGMFVCRTVRTWVSSGRTGGGGKDHLNQRDLVSARAFATRITL